MKTSVSLFILFVAVLAGGYLLSERPGTNAPTNTSLPSKGTSYTAAQVAAHDTRSSCWTSIGGNVYDLTAWISQHPGGEAAILSICGKDGTQAFEAQHGGSRDTRPQEILATFKIGTLAS